MHYTYQDIAKMVDHSLLNPALTTTDLDQGILLALAYDTASVCILPYYLKRCAEGLRGSTVKASTTIGFPTEETPQQSSSLRPARHWLMAAKSWTWW